MDEEGHSHDGSRPDFHQRQSYRKKLRLLPTLLVWLSLATAVIRENSNNNNGENNSSNNPSATQKFLVSAAESAASGRRAAQPSAARLHADRELQILEEDGAIELLDDLQEHLHHHHQQQQNPKRAGDTLDTQQNERGVIVVVAVDGTMAGISKETGEVLWKHSEAPPASTSSPSFGSLKVNNKRNTNSNVVDASQILQPLVSTTTTTKSASTASYAVVPSIDGTVFTTSNDMTVSTSVKELVARSPFLDPRGRFYVGSRHTTAAALDVDTGEILRVVSTGSNPPDVDIDAYPSLQDRNVVWIGRVDHTISVQDARTGIMDAQFSVAEVMSVSDMHGMARKEAWTPDRLREGRTEQSAGLPALDDKNPLDAALFSSKGLPVGAQRDGDNTATLVATPNGNVALYNVQDDHLSWVTNESFGSPIAYAMDAGTGLPIGVDIIPDVIDPNGDNDYLRREMERHLSTAAGDEISDEQTIVGAMPNGQLYALPLGLKATSTASSVTATSSSISSASSAAALASSSSASARHSSQVSQLPGRPSANFHDPRNQQNRGNDKSDFGQSNVDPQTSGKHGLLTGKKPCTASSPSFPACLVPHHNRNKFSSEAAPPLGTGSHQYGLSHYPNSEGAVALMTSTYHKKDGGFYHPDFGYVSPEDLYLFQQRSQSKSYKKVLWLLSSWLPPTILCIFVASFELGRRKRMRDEKQQKQMALMKVSQLDSANGAIVSRDDAVLALPHNVQLEQKHVISVSDEVLGYGGHGTVVYKGLLDGRDVAVKRMLKAYHASADREISLLIESDGDPNVVRYFLKEVRGDFVYLALELCDLSLHDLIGVLRENQQRQHSLSPQKQLVNDCAIDSEVLASTKRILLQIASGVKHLHSLRIVHRYVVEKIGRFRIKILMKLQDLL
jgi:Protein kinase domain